MDVKHRLAYAVGFLKGNAYKQILPLIDEGNINIASVEALITRLENAFGDPDRVRTAEGSYYPSRNSLNNYARGICHHRGEHISELKLPE